MTRKEQFEDKYGKLNDTKLLLELLFELQEQNAILQRTHSDLRKEVQYNGQLLKENLSLEMVNSKDLEILEKIRSNTSIMVWWLIIIPMLISALYYFVIFSVK